MPVATVERLIMETGDETLVRKLHAMRASRAVFEHERSRWIITRIAVNTEAPANAPCWSVFARRSIG
jgi:hypothetical protein